jgi:hypothetical protein
MVQGTDIPRPELAIAEGCGRCVRVAPVAQHDGSPSHNNLPALTVRQGPPLLIDDYALQGCGP